jgi:hypothetical protein
VIEQLYEAAASAGFLKPCRWQPSAGGVAHTHQVGLRAPEDSVLDNLTLSTETVITYPATFFPGLASRETVEVDGVRYQVRDVRAAGDGSEMHARLTRL